MLSAEALGRVLSSELDAEVVVAELAPVTAGARRINVLFDATIDGETSGFCITQQPNTGEAFERSMLSEVQWLRNAAAADVRVAEVITASEDVELLGGPFFVSRRIDGATIPKKVIELCAAHPGLGATVAREIGESMARLHATSLDHVPADVERPTTSTVDAALDWVPVAVCEVYAVLGEDLDCVRQG